MNKVVKYLLIAFGSLVVLVVAAAVAVILLVDPNDYKDDIAKLVKDRTGRTLAFGGDLSLSLFPWLGVETGKLSLSNAPGFGDTPFVSLDRADVGIKLLPLISGAIEIGKVQLDGLYLELARNEQGVANWDDLAKAGEEEKKAEPEKSEEGGLDLESISVSGLAVKNARVIFDDRQAGKRYEIRKLNLSTGHLALGKLVTIKLSLDAASSDPEAEVLLTLAAKVLPDVAANVYTVRSLDSELKVNGKVLPTDSLDLELDTDKIVLDLGKGDYSLDGLIAVLKTAGGELPVQNLKARLAAGSVKGNLKGQLHGAGGVKLGLEAVGEKLPGGKADVQGQADWIGVDLSRGNATLSGLDVTAYDVPVSVNARASDILKAPRAEGRLEVARFDPRKAMAALGMEAVRTTDPNALKSLEAALDFAYAPDAARVSDATVRLDDTTIKARADVSNMNATPGYVFAVAVDAIDVDRYLPPKETDKAAEPEPEAEKPASVEKGKEAELIPVEQIRKLDLDGRLDVGRLRARAVDVTDVAIRILAKNGVVAIDPCDLKVFNGTVDVAGRLDASGKVPDTALKANLSRIRTGPLLKAAVGKDWVSGDLDLKTDLKTLGATQKAMTKNLDGTLSFAMRSGYVKGLDLLGEVDEAYDEAKGVSQAKEHKEKRTEFANLKGNVSIKKGVARTGDVQLSSAFLVVKGRGDVDLPKEKIDFVLETELQTGAQKLVGKNVGQLLNVSIPIYVSGDLSDPSIGPDMKEFVFILAKKGLGAAGGVVGGAVGGAVGAVESLGKAVFGGASKKEQPAESGEQDKPSGEQKPSAKEKLLQDLNKLF